MSKLLVCFALALVIVCCLSFIEAAPAQNLLDWHTAIEKIIAAYEQNYPGPSKRYPAEYAHVIDPNHFNP